MLLQCNKNWAPGTRYSVYLGVFEEKRSAPRLSFPLPRCVGQKRANHSALRRTKSQKSHCSANLMLAIEHRYATCTCKPWTIYAECPPMRGEKTETAAECLPKRSTWTQNHGLWPSWVKLSPLPQHGAVLRFRALPGAQTDIRPDGSSWSARMEL